MTTTWVYRFDQIDQAQDFVGGDWDGVRGLPPMETPPAYAANVVRRGDPSLIPAEGVPYP